jgi:hypothetical protein
MLTQRQQFTNTQAVWILAIALLAAVALFGGAFFFGTALSADTVESVAPSPLGSSLTAVRETIPDDYVERVRKSAAPASRFEDRYDRMNSSSAAERSASLASAGHSPSADFYDSSSTSPARDSSASLRAAEQRWASSASLKALEERWAPFYAGLDKALKDAGARP